MTASAIARAAVEPPRTLRVRRAPTTVTARELATAWPPTCTRGTGRRRARRPRRTPARQPRRSIDVGRGVEQRRRDARRPSTPRRASAAPARRSAVERRSSSGSPSPTSSAAFAPSRPAGRDRERLAALAVEAGLRHERGERAAERGVDHVGAGAERRARRTRGRRRGQRRTSRGRVVTVKRMATGPPVSSGSGLVRVVGYVSARGRAGRRLPASGRACRRDRRAG